MPRGRRRLTVVCAESGCRESVFCEYPNLTEYADGVKRHKGWKCSRHEHPERNLRPGNEVTEVTLTAVKVPFKSDFAGGPEFLDGLFWREDGEEHASSGYEHGPGFNAHASDFPEGSRLVVTARILPPEKDGDDA
jgi:hypothetical protein